MKESMAEVIQLTRRLVYMYYLLKDKNGIMQYLDINATWKGLGTDMKVYSRNELQTRLQEFFEERKVETFEVLHEKYKVLSYGVNYYVIQANMKFLRVVDEIEMGETGRISQVTIIERDGILYVTKVENKDVYDNQDARYLAKIEEEASKKKLLDTIWSSGFLTTTNNENRAVIDVDDNLCQMLGYSKEELLDKCQDDFWTMVNPEDVTAAKQQIFECFQRSNEYSSKYRMCRKDGSMLWVWDAGLKVEHDDGDEVFIQSLIADINELEQSRFERDATIDIFPGAVVFIQLADGKAHVTRAKENFYHMLKVTPEEFEMNETLFVHPEDIKKYKALVETSMRQRKKIDLDIRFVAADETVIWSRIIGRYYGMGKGSDEYIFFLVDRTREKNAELAIQREKERYRIATEGMADIVYEYDTVHDRMQYHLDENVVPYIPKYEEGVHEHWLKTMLEGSFVHPDDLNELLDLKHQGIFYQCELRIHVVKNNQPVYQWFAFQATKIYDNGVMIRVVGTLRDIEEQRRMKEQNEELQQIFNRKLISDYDCILKICIEDSRVERFSGGGFDNLSMTLPKQGEKFEQQMNEFYVHPLDRERYQKLLNMKWLQEMLCSGREEVVMYIRVRNDKGDYRWKCYRCSYLDPDLKYILCSIQDVHDARMEQQMYEENNQRILQDALSKAKEAKEATSRYFRLITEELKTPTNVLAMLAEKAMKLDGEEAKEYTKRVYESATYLGQTMNNLLELEKVNSGELSLVHQKFLLSEMFNYETSKLLDVIKRKGIEFKLDLSNIEENTVIGDEGRLRQIVNSLLNNCLYFSNENGYIHVTIKEDVIEKKIIRLQIIIEENGIPLKDGELSRVFQEYNSNVNDAWGARNSEIALTLTKELIDLMGGDIDISFVNPSENRIVICLPLYADNSSDETEDTSQDDEDTILRVNLEDYNFLIIENPDRTPDIFHSILEVNNARIDVVHSAEEALKTFSMSPPAYFNVVLSDLKLPGMSCSDFITKFREYERMDAKRMPVIVLTQGANDEEILLCYSAGANIILERPVDINKLKEVLLIYGGGSQVC